METASAARAGRRKNLSLRLAPRARRQKESFDSAFESFYRERGERPEKPHNWMIKIAHNVCRMRWRQSGRRPQEVPLDRAGEPAAPDDERAPLEEILSALAKLPFNQRAAIVMREVEDRSY